nr:hypothetical protein [Tanacetum cinerariifolium]
TPLPNPPTITSTESEIHAFEAAVCDDKDITRIILESVYPELCSSSMGYIVYGMFHTIKDMYQGKAFVEILEFVNMLQTGNTSASVCLSSDVLKDYMDRLDRFGSKKLNNNVIETIIKILPNKANDFNMEHWDMVLSHLKLMLISSDYKYLPKVRALLLRNHDIKSKRLDHSSTLLIISFRAFRIESKFKLLPKLVPVSQIENTPYPLELAIVYNDALASKLGFSSEPIVSPQHVDEVDLKDETSLSEYNVISFNDLFPFNIYFVNDSKFHTDNDDDDKIDIKQSLRDISIEPLPNVISIDVGIDAQGLNKLLETSHDAII